jgi:hypothetical protein
MNNKKSWTFVTNFPGLTEKIITTIKTLTTMILNGLVTIKTNRTTKDTSEVYTVH